MHLGLLNHFQRAKTYSHVLHLKAVMKKTRVCVRESILGTGCTAGLSSGSLLVTVLFMCNGVY